MLAMHYAIPLKEASQIAAVRARAVERGPLFDGMKGLGTKLFLIDPSDPCYATFYLWRDPDAAQAFLEGPFFKALSDSFGRPEVKLLLTGAADLPFAAGETVGLLSNPTHEVPVRTLDPRTGDVIALAPERAGGRRFEVMYRAFGALG